MRPSAWLLPLLVLLLLIGHVCEVAAVADLPDVHHGGNGHSDDEALRCDGLGLRPATVPTLPPPTLAVATAQPIVASAPAHAIASPRPDSSPPAQRSRLFLLFASPLI